MKMLIMGAPGSGKGTQAEIISEKTGIPTISTGAMLREEMAKGSKIGKEAEGYIKQGLFVPDDVIIAMVMERVSRDDCANGYILDGFPRTLKQAEAMTEAGIKVDKVLLIDTPDQEIIDRLGGRRVCETCGATFHVVNKPSPAGDNCPCGGKLITRADDTPETIKKRLEVYYDQTAPILDYYSELVVKVESVPGIAEMNERVMEALGL